MNTDTELLPTDAMIEAGAAALAHESDFEGRFVELHEMSKAIYREKAAAVITAALSTIPTSPREGDAVTQIVPLACPDCKKHWRDIALPENASELLDAFYSAVPEQFGSCMPDDRHGTVAASIPLAPNDLVWLRGIAAALAASGHAKALQLIVDMEPEHNPEAMWMAGVARAALAGYAALSKPVTEANGMREALAIAVAGLGRVNVRCFDRISSPLKPIGDIARETLIAVCSALGDEAYDKIASEALAAPSLSERGKRDGLD